MRPIKILSLLLLFSLEILAVDKGNIRGFVTDSLNGEPISYANVVVKGTRLGSSSDNKGYFFIAAVPSGKQIIRITYLGYETKEIEVDIPKDEILQINVQIVKSSVLLNELNVIGERSAKENETDLGLQKISAREIEMLPQSVESDIFKVLQASPGVSSTGDVTSRYYVRGGGSDQNLLLLNGVTIYNPFHALGIFSVVDPEMISVLEFYKGGFPSEYGGRLSSIANVVSKDGNKNNYSGSLNASFISGKAMLEGPIPHGSFIITGRKSYFSEVLKNYFNDKKAPFNFYDLSFKVNYSNPDLNNGKIILHGFISRDDLNNNDPKSEDYFVANKLFGLNWYQIWGSPLMSNFSLSYSQYGAQVFPNLSTAKPRRNSVDDVSMNFDFTYMYQSKDELHFGLQNTFLSTDLILQNLYGANTNIASNGTMIKGYVNYKLYRYDNWGFDIGARMNFFSASKRRPFLFEPRINIIFRPIHTLSLKAAIGRFSQEIVSLTNENELISIFEPWTIVPSYLDPPEATHFILGAEYYLNESFSLQVEGYYKLLSSLFDLNPRKFSARDYDYINISGRAYGIEGLIKYQFGSVYVQSSYTLSWAFKENRDIVTIPRYDVRHSINFLAGISLGAGWEVNFNWSFNSGMPFRPIAGYYDRLMINPWESNYLFGDYVPVTYWSETNNKRLPYYHRLDLSISKDFRISKADVSLGASIINAYNQKNVFYFNKDSGEKVYMLPFFPSATLKVKI